MIQQLGVVTTGSVQEIGQARQGVELVLLIDRRGEFEDARVGAPWLMTFDVGWMEGVAVEITEQDALHARFSEGGSRLACPFEGVDRLDRGVYRGVPRRFPGRACCRACCRSPGRLRRSCPGRDQFLQKRRSVGVALRRLDRAPQAWIAQQGPDTPAAGSAGEEPCPVRCRPSRRAQSQPGQKAVRLKSLACSRTERRARPGDPSAGQPFCLGHASSSGMEKTTLDCSENGRAGRGVSLPVCRGPAG